MKKFDLERAIAGDPLVTRDGTKVTEFHRFNDVNVSNQACRGVINGCIFAFSDNGTYGISPEHPCDLFMAPVVKKYYENVYRNKRNGLWTGRMHENSETLHKECRDITVLNDLIKTIEIEIKE